MRCVSLSGAAVAGVYRVAGKDMAPLEALVFGVGQTTLSVVISFSRVLATLWRKPSTSLRTDMRVSEWSQSKLQALIVASYVEEDRKEFSGRSSFSAETQRELGRRLVFMLKAAPGGDCAIISFWTWKPCFGCLSDSLCQRPSLGHPHAFLAADSWRLPVALQRRKLFSKRETTYNNEPSRLESKSWAKRGV